MSATPADTGPSSSDQNRGLIEYVPAKNLYGHQQCHGQPHPEEQVFDPVVDGTTDFF